MKIQKFLFVMITVIATIGIISCSQKLPKNTMSNTGVLVIAHEATNTATTEGFGYRYLFSHYPKTDVDIEVIPGNRDLLIFGNFPPGEYRIDGITVIGIANRNLTADKNTSKRSFSGPSFEIKPNQITLLRKKFIVEKFDHGSGKRWRQSWKFRNFDEKTKGDLYQQIKNLENSEEWSVW